MKTKLIRNVSLALLATASLFAQSRTSMKVQVPFGFHVGNAMLPAGEYTVDNNVSPHVLRVRSIDGSPTAMVLTTGLGKRSGITAARLIFNRYGDTYFLSQVWTRGGISGSAVSQSKREIQAAQNLRPGTESIMAAK